MDVSPIQPADVQGAPYLKSKRQRFASWLEPQEALYHLDARPIFAVGEHNGKSYDKADLAAMVDAYEPLLDQIMPRIKLGHDDAQSYAKLKFAGMGTDKDEKSLGLPALGFIARPRLNDEYTDRNGNVVESGTQILADFVNMPSDLKDGLESLQYPGVSAEILRNYQDKRNPNKTWPLVLKAVALLGDELPAVRTLGPLVELNADESGEVEIVTFSQECLNMGMGLPSGATAPPQDKIDTILAVLKHLVELQKADNDNKVASDDEAKLRASDMAQKEKASEDMEDEEAAKVPSAPAVPAKQDGPAKPFGKSDEEKMSERFAQLQHQTRESEKQARQALAEVAQLKAETAFQKAKIEAERFSESVTSAQNLKLPVSSRPDLERLFLNAPDSAKFADGQGASKSFREQFVDFVNGLPVLARPEAFQDRARHLHASQAGTTAETVEKMAQKLAAEKNIPSHEAFMQVHRSLSDADYRAIRGADLGQ